MSLLNQNRLAAILLMAPFAPCAAEVLISHTGSFNAEFEDEGVLASLDFSELPSTENTAVFFLYSFDASTPSSTATFAGEAMTTVDSGRFTLGYLTNPEHSSGDIALDSTSGRAGLELAFWGLAQGIDTEAIKVATGSTVTAGTQINSTLPALDAGDVVIAGFALNNYGPPAYSGGVALQDGDSIEHDAIITLATMTTPGDHAPTTNAPNHDNSASGVSIAYTSIPEPNTTALLAILGSLHLIARRLRAFSPANS